MSVFRNHRTLQNGSLMKLLVHAFAGMITVILLLGGILLILNDRIRNEMEIEPHAYRLLEQETDLAREEYANLKVKKSLGKKGYIEIVDEDARVLYSSNPAIQNHYTRDSLAYISDIDKETYYFIQPSWIGNQLTGYLLMQYSANDTSVDEEDRLTGISMFDTDGNVIYTNIELNHEKLTAKELEFLFENSDDEAAKMVLQKHQFLTMNGETRYLLIHADSIYQTTGKMYHLVAGILLGVFVLLVVGVVILTGTLIASKIRKPMRRLQAAIDQFALGSREKMTDYEGPKEFVQVIDTFNEMETKLEVSEREQRLLQDQKRKMVADLSHDLKTPITVIQGYVNAIQDGLIPQEEQQRYLAVIMQKTQMLSELINQFSDYAKMDHPDYHPDLQEADLCEYMREYVAGRYEELRMAGYELDIDIPSKPIKVLLDQGQLKRVFENVISNTMKYAGSGTTIYISLKKEEEKVMIEIGDDGPGIPDEIRAHIFDPFVTGNDARTSGKGTGLGMSIAKEIIEWHQGTIEAVDSDQGTRYRIVMPLK